MSLLIKNGNIITAVDNYKADIFIEDSKISIIGKHLDIEADTIIDAKDKFIFPGGIDPHVHLDLPFKNTTSSDNFETGTLAALYGGTTTVIDFATQYKGESLYTAVNNWKIKAEGNAYSDYAFHLAISELNDNTMSELESVILNEGITSFKVYMAYKDTLMIDDAQIIALMEIAKKYNCIVLAHATNGHIINYLVSKFKWEGKLATLYHYLSQPAITEAEATGRFSDLAYITGARSYIVHLSCEEALNKIREVTKRNQKVYAETCIQYLLLDYSLYEQAADAIKWIISPPLREKKDQQALWAAINQGLIQTVATDHCPFLMKDKKVGEKDFSQVPNGMPGIENRVELLFSEGVKKGKITINKFVELISTNAAKIFGLFPQKGNITVGADADLVVFAPDEKHVISAKTHHMNCDYSCYEGLEVTGKCKTVILRGKIAIHDNEVYINKGFGKYIKRYHPMI